jgi:GntR family transcriptional regulator
MDRRPASSSRDTGVVVPLRRDSPVPMHRQIAQQLRQAVADGRYKPGDRIPTEPQLSLQFDVSRITARQAVEHLVREGLVSRKQGKGTFVQEPVVRHDLLGLKGIYDELVEQGLHPQTELVEFGHRRAPRAVADRLGSGTHKLTNWKRLYRLNGKPLGLSVVFLGFAAGQQDRATIQRLPTYEILRTVLRVKVDHADVTIRHAPGSGAVCKLLGVPAGTALMVLERVEHTLYYAQAGSYEFSIKVRGPMRLASSVRQAPRAVGGRP